MNSSSKFPAKILKILYLLCLVLISGCIKATPTPTPTPEIQPTAAPTATSTPTPLGHPNNPVVIGLVNAQPETPIEESVNLMLDYLNTSTTLSISAHVFPSDEQLFAALENHEIHAAWLQPLTYIYAHEKGLTDVGLLTNHFGAYFYGTQFLANIKSGFTAYFDPAVNKSTTDLITALSQFDGKRPCWVEPGSISGYILPLGLLEQEDIYIDTGVMAQTYSAVVRALYIKGVCDFGVTFAIFGDPRTSSAVLSDLPDALDRVIVIWQTEPIIPNLNFSFTPSVGEAVRAPILTALLDYVDTEDGKRILTQTLEGYDIQDLKIVDDSIYDPLRSAVQFSGADLSTWIGR